MKRKDYFKKGKSAYFSHDGYDCTDYWSKEAIAEYQRGWDTSKRLDEQGMICPCCNSELDEKLSGKFCPDVYNCGFHTHNES